MELTHLILALWLFQGLGCVTIRTEVLAQVDAAWGGEDVPCECSRTHLRRIVGKASGATR